MNDLNVLIVDDHKFQANVLANNLKKINILKVKCVYSGFDALSLMEKQDFDLIFCDLKMPEMDGVKLLSSLNELGFSGGVVVLSAMDLSVLSTVKTMCANFKFSFVDVIEKPIKSERLSFITEQFNKNTYTNKVPTENIEYDIDDVLFALRNGEIINYYQPQVDFKSKETVSVEVLARWRHPVYGILPPSVFLPIIEEHNLTDEIFNIVFINTLKEYSSGSLLYKSSINVTQDSLSKKNFSEDFFYQCEKYAIEPNKFTIELTEREAFNASTILLENLSRLRIQGVGVSIDDFGTGYSSLMKLSTLPFTEMKVDRSFVTNCLEDDAKKIIIDFSYQLSKEMNMAIVAEGVEDEKTWSYLNEMGFDLCQGFYTGKPMSIEELKISDEFDGV
ncbi:EAL domain-containing protein [Aliivibrio fischeri]|uniref:EAL domain-containing response regulator n=1 Tax=Aliivibrio fischeri TaxID=668 RepID=UPI0018C5E712|nr:EAL domain-containing response regulator [Aliivibrio fischeri]